MSQIFNTNSTWNVCTSGNCPNFIQGPPVPPINPNDPGYNPIFVQFANSTNVADAFRLEITSPIGSNFLRVYFARDRLWIDNGSGISAPVLYSGGNLPLIDACSVKMSFTFWAQQDVFGDTYGFIRMVDNAGNNLINTNRFFYAFGTNPNLFPVNTVTILTNSNRIETLAVTPPSNLCTSSSSLPVSSSSAPVSSSLPPGSSSFPPGSSSLPPGSSSLPPGSSSLTPISSSSSQPENTDKTLLWILLGIFLGLALLTALGLLLTIFVFSKKKPTILQKRKINKIEMTEKTPLIPEKTEATVVY